MMNVSIKHAIISQTLLTPEYFWPQNIDKNSHHNMMHDQEIL
jgi:hypothetical protein